MHDKSIGRLYGNAVNLSGVWSQTPMKLRWDRTLGEWYTDDGNLYVLGPGVDVRDGCVVFADPDKKVVEAWTRGVVSALTLVAGIRH